MAGAADPREDYTRFTDEEVEAIGKVRQALLDKGVDESQINHIELVVTTLNSKLRVDKALEKYEEYFKMKETFKLDDVTDDQWERYLTEDTGDRYKVAGRDVHNSGIMWITQCPTPVEEESHLVKAGGLYFYAAHADLRTLRNGITFVIMAGGETKRVGNEQKLQRAWSSFAMRPQAILVTDASRVKRVFINVLLKFASLFTSSKVLSRVKFIRSKDLPEYIPQDQFPHYAGGTVEGKPLEWVKQRLRDFPQLPEGAPGRVEDPLAEVMSKMGQLKLVKASNEEDE